MGDVYLIEESFTNYMSNALNHVDGERIIEVKVTRGAGKARISVFNTGARIPQEDIDQIWVKFYKVDKARTRNMAEAVSDCLSLRQQWSGLDSSAVFRIMKTVWNFGSHWMLPMKCLKLEKLYKAQKKFN